MRPFVLGALGAIAILVVFASGVFVGAVAGYAYAGLYQPTEPADAPLAIYTI